MMDFFKNCRILKTNRSCTKIMVNFKNSEKKNIDLILCNQKYIKIFVKFFYKFIKNDFGTQSILYHCDLFTQEN